MTSAVVLSQFLNSVNRVSYYMKCDVSIFSKESKHESILFTQPLAKKAKMNRFTVFESQNRLRTRKKMNAGL